MWNEFFFSTSIPHTHTRWTLLLSFSFRFSGALFMHVLTGAAFPFLYYIFFPPNTPKYVLWRRFEKKKKRKVFFWKREKLKWTGAPWPGVKGVGERKKKRRKKHPPTDYYTIRRGTWCGILPKPRIPFSSSFCRENRRREGADGRMRGHVSPSSILVRPQRAGYCRNIEIERGQIVGLWESWVNCYTGRWVYRLL